MLDLNSVHLSVFPQVNRLYHSSLFILAWTLLNVTEVFHNLSRKVGYKKIKGTVLSSSLLFSLQQRKWMNKGNFMIDTLTFRDGFSFWVPELSTSSDPYSPGGVHLFPAQDESWYWKITELWWLSFSAGTHKDLSNLITKAPRELGWKFSSWTLNL